MAEKPAKPITDIQKPGKTPAAATSRPIIVGHGIPLKDPMMAADEAKPAEQQSAEKLTRPTSKVVKPLSEQAPVASTQPEPAKKDVEDAAISDQAVVDAVVERAGDKKQAEKDADVLHKRLELVEQLVQSKKYFVPIGVAAKKRTHRIELGLFVALLILLVGVVLAIDADVINTDIQLPFDLLKSAP